MQEKPPERQEASGGVARAGTPRATLQLTRILIGKAIGAAQQNTCIRPAHGPFFPVLKDAKRLLLFEQQGGDAAGLLHGEGLVFFGLRQIEKFKFDGRLVRVGVRGGRDKLLQAAVVKIARLTAHELAEHKVDGVGHSLRAAEVAVKHHAGRICILLPVINREGGAAAQKDLRHRLTETINALLDVSPP